MQKLDTPVTVTVANGDSIKSTESGKLNLWYTTLQDVLVVPALGRNLLLVNHTTTLGDKEWAFGNGLAKLVQYGQPIITAQLKNGPIASTLPVRQSLPGLCTPLSELTITTDLVTLVSKKSYNWEGKGILTIQ